MPTPISVRMRRPKLKALVLDEQAFEDVRMPAHMRPPQAAGFVEMCVRPFEMFAPPPLQSQPTRAADAPAIGIHRIPSHRLLLPVAPPAIRLGDVRPQIERRAVSTSVRQPVSEFTVAPPRARSGRWPGRREAVAVCS